MSDDDRDIDIESDDDNDSDIGGTSGGAQRHTSTQNFTQEEKRAHHNALERKRRDHIKESFTSLREAVPSLKGEKASRAQILKKTTECIQIMRRKIQANQKDVEDIKKQNAVLEAQSKYINLDKNRRAVKSLDIHQCVQLLDGGGVTNTVATETVANANVTDSSAAVHRELSSRF